MIGFVVAFSRKFLFSFLTFLSLCVMVRVYMKYRSKL